MTIYTKTATGADEIAHRSGAIGLRARRVLILIDGVRSVADLHAISGDPELDTTLVQLQRCGFISATAAETVAAVTAAATMQRAAEAPPAVAAHAVTAAPSLQAARDFMINTLRTFHGPYNKLGLMKRIQDSKQRVELEALFEEWLASIAESRLGRKRTAELSERLRAVM
jgi:hypothetical protein